MSRSRKKHNMGSICKIRAGEMKKWKNAQNRWLRRLPISEDLADGAAYKRKSEIWDSPSDGKTIYSDLKFLRK